MQSNTNPRNRTSSDLGWMQILFFFIGKPVKIHESPLHTTPYLTYGLSATIAMVSILAWYTPAREVLFTTLAFYPDAVGVHWVVGLVGCVFLHAGWLHLLGNLYFLYLFGRNVECRFGRRRMIWLFFTSAALGSYVHGLFSDIGLIGASGGVFGVLTFYALLFPSSRIMWLPIVGFFVRLIALQFEKFRRGMSVRTFLIIYLLFQILLLHEQLFAEGNISALAHLGGGFAGLVIYFAWRRGWVP